MDRLLKTAAPTEVASNSNYNKAALKKVVKEYSAKDVRKNIDVLFRRVEKHFIEGNQHDSQEVSTNLVIKVWRACELKYISVVREVEAFHREIYDDASGGGVPLGFVSENEVEKMFRSSGGR